MRETVKNVFKGGEISKSQLTKKWIAVINQIEREKSAGHLPSAKSK